MKLSNIEIFILLIVFISFCIGIFFYPQMEENMASHWNIKGEVDGRIPKFWGLFLMPFLSLGLFLLFLAIPKIDPLKQNIKSFKRYYDIFILIVTLFLFYIYLLTITWNAGIRFDFIRFLAPAFGLLFYYCGILTEHAKQNWFIGIRTPWTLSSESVWNKTHKIGGKLFKLSGLIAVFGVFLPEYAFYIILLTVVLFTTYMIIYSYIEYQREKNEKGTSNN